MALRGRLGRAETMIVLATVSCGPALRAADRAQEFIALLQC
jgi:hypothetical protein